MTAQANVRANISSKIFILLLALGLLTLLDHSYLTYEFYNLNSGMGSGGGICNISTKFNCDVVAASSYAKMSGIPMALLGLITQLVLLILLLAGQSGLTQNPSQTRRYFFWGTAFVALISIVMGSISTFKLGTYCLFCMGAYLLSFLSVIAAWFYQEKRNLGSSLGDDLRDLFTTSRWVLILAILIPVCGIVANGVIGSSYDLNKMEPMIRANIEAWKTAPEQTFDLSRGLVLQNGSQTPLMTIVEFADFRCPHCRLAYPGLHAFTQSHPDVKLIFKSFPLDGTCNKALTRTGDGLTCKLAFATFCAQETAQKGWEAHHWIYDRQEEFQSVTDFPDKLHQLSQDLGLNEEKMNTCINSDATTQKIMSMAAEGANAKIEGTPTIFINNKLYAEAQFLPFLDELYQELKVGK